MTLQNFPQGWGGAHATKSKNRNMTNSERVHRIVVVVLKEVYARQILTLQKAGRKWEVVEGGRGKNQCPSLRSTALALLQMHIKIYSSMLHTFSKTKVNTHLDTDTFCTLEGAGWEKIFDFLMGITVLVPPLGEPTLR